MVRQRFCSAAGVFFVILFDFHDNVFRQIGFHQAQNSAIWSDQEKGVGEVFAGPVVILVVHRLDRGVYLQQRDALRPLSQTFRKPEIIIIIIMVRQNRDADVDSY